MLSQVRICCRTNGSGVSMATLLHRQRQPRALMKSDLVSVRRCSRSELERCWEEVMPIAGLDYFVSVIAFCRVSWSINPKSKLGLGHGV